MKDRRHHKGRSDVCCQPELPIRVVTEGAVRVITLNRPAALNSSSAAMHEMLLPALQAAAADSAVRAVVITGAGRGFCAGQDLNDSAMAAGVDASQSVLGAATDFGEGVAASRAKRAAVFSDR